MKEKDKNVNDLYDENLMAFVKKLANTIDSIDLLEDPIKNTIKLHGEIRLIGYDMAKKESNNNSVFTLMRSLLNIDGYKRLFIDFQTDKIVINV